MKRAHTFFLMLTIALAATVLVGWNSSRFIGAKPVIRAKNLAFLPAPETAKLLAMGHSNTMAKLRWIDSFAYFQYQIDVKNDAVSGGGSGFQRLYQTLIELDGKFQPFYEHAALNLSGILSQHWMALGFLQRGNFELPKSRELWRNTVTTLKVFFAYDVKHPEAFDAVLSAWESNEELPEAKRMVWDWKKNFGAKAFGDLQQLPYWLEQLERTAANTPNGEFVDSVVREMLARYGEKELNALYATWRIVRGGTPRTKKELVDNLARINPLKPLPATEPALTQLGELAQPALLATRYTQELPAFGPFLVDAASQRVVLRTDPYGLAWELSDGVIISPGLKRMQFDKQLAGATGQLLALAQKTGTWPATLAEATAMGLTVPTAPAGAGAVTVELHDRVLVARWAVEAQASWPLRKTATTR
jgi:hypothetical protein